MKDYYKTLGIDKGASEDDIKRAYRKIAIKYHPDKNPSKEAENKFREATEAYEILKDPGKRKNYNDYGSPEGPGGSGFYTNSFKNKWGSNPYNNGDGISFDFEDIFEASGLDFNAFLKGRHRETVEKNSKKNGSTLQAKVSVTLEEVAGGAQKTIKYRRNIKCPDCSGTRSKNKKLRTCNACRGSGKSSIFGVCAQCKGIGTMPEVYCHRCLSVGTVVFQDQITIDIPKGVVDGNNITIKGKGNESIDNGENGDFIVYVMVQYHPIFTRIGNDLASTIYVDNIDAVLGGTQSIETIYSTKLNIKVPPNIKPKSKLRIPGQGVPNRHNGINGDLILLVEITFPSEISEEEKELYIKLRNIRDLKAGENNV